jgi:glycerol-3-phosphate acyltransferase PlsY
MSEELALWIAASYLLGAIPTSWIVVKLARGQDLRSLGSGNLGATNLYRQLGWRYAVPVGLFDMGKGAAPVLLFAPRVGGEAGIAGGGDVTALLLGSAAVLGHIFSVFVRFRGGKGVATGAGVVLALAPWAFVAALIVWVAIVRLTGYVSLGSMLAAVTLPPAAWLLYRERQPLVWLFTGLALLVIALHRSNLQRLLAGTEHRFRVGRGGTDREGIRS